MKLNAPTPEVAFDLVTAARGFQPVEMRRFKTGSAHYVFEALFEDRAPVVIRIAKEENRLAMEGALKLSRILRPLGVPLPEIFVEGMDSPFPYLILERLPGADLGHVINDLSESSLRSIATKVASSQTIVSKLLSTGRYGYAVSAEAAPHERWHCVLNDNLIRSRKRIETAELFDCKAVDQVATLVSAAQKELDSIPSIPFLHDTTTKNVIVTQEGVFSGIVDVDDLCFGDPRYVLALTLAALTAFGGPVSYVDAWMEIAGHKDDYIFRLYVALFIVDFMSEHGQRFNDNQASSSSEDRQKLLQVFDLCMRKLQSFQTNNRKM